MSNYVLDKAYRITNSGGIEAGRVVVRGGTEGDCQLPSGANAGNVLGVTTHSQPRQNRFVAVRRMGLVLATAAGAIEAGRPVCIADDHGRIAQLARPRFVFGSGSSQVIVEWIDRDSFTPAANITLNDAGAGTSFGWSTGDTGFVLNLTTQVSTGTILETVATLIAHINGDSTLSKYLKASKGPSAVDGTAVTDASVHATNFGNSMNAIGIAEQAATQPGDLIDVLLIP